VPVCSLSCPAGKTRASHIVMCVACLAPPYVSTLSHKRQDFKNIVTEHNMRFFLYYFSEMFHILRRIQRHIVINVLMSSCEVSVILVRF